MNLEGVNKNLLSYDMGICPVIKLNDPNSLFKPEYNISSPLSTDICYSSKILQGNIREKINLFNDPVNSFPADKTLVASVGNITYMAKGDKGEAVAKLQKRLTALGYDVTATAVFGPTTESVIKSFQKNHGLQQTGILDAKTLSEIEKAENDPYNIVLGKKIAKSAKNIAVARDTVGLCYNAVAESVENVIGPFLTGLSAYEAADQFANNPKFKEISTKPEDLPKLPAGAIVVWGKTSKSPHGHISVSLGNGQEASDHVEAQRTELRGFTNFRVFIPTKKA